MSDPQNMYMLSLDERYDMNVKPFIELSEFTVYSNHTTPINNAIMTIPFMFLLILYKRYIYENRHFLCNF